MIWDDMYVTLLCVTKNAFTSFSDQKLSNTYFKKNFMKLNFEIKQTKVYDTL